MKIEFYCGHKGSLETNSPCAVCAESPTAPSAHQHLSAER